MNRKGGDAHYPMWAIHKQRIVIRSEGCGTCNELSSHGVLCEEDGPTEHLALKARGVVYEKP